MLLGGRRLDQNHVVVLDYLPSWPPPLVSRQHRAGLPVSGVGLPVLGAGLFEELFPGGPSGSASVNKHLQPERVPKQLFDPHKLWG